MKREEMTKIVNEELEKIPRKKRGHPQNLLRTAYNMCRRHQLSLAKPEKPMDTLQKCIKLIQKDHLDFVPDVDFTFFRDRK